MTVPVIMRLSDTVGAEVVGLAPEHLAIDNGLAAMLLDALGHHGVLVFRGLHLGPAPQVQFCKKLGSIDESNGHHPIVGIYRVTLDPRRTPRPNT